MNKLILFAALAIAALTFQANAAAEPKAGPTEPVPPRTLSLDDCVRMAVDNNISLIVAKNSVDRSVLDLAQAESAFDMLLYASSSYNDSVSVSPSPFITGAEQLRSSGLNSVLGMRKTFLPGTSLDVFLSEDKARTNSMYNLLNPSWSSALGFRLSQPILKGRGADYNGTAMRLASNLVKASEYDAASQLMSLVYDTEVTYWNLVDAHNQMKAREKQLEAARRLLDINRAKEAARTISPVEVLQAEANVAAQEEGMLLAEKAILDIEDRLKNLTFPPDLPKEQWEARIIPATQSEFVEHAYDLETETAKAYGNRPEYLKMQKLRENGALGMDRAESEMLPALDLSATFQMSGIDGALGSSASDVFDADNRAWQLGLSLQIPLGNNAAKAGLAKAKIDLRNMDLRIKEAELQISLEVRTAVREISTAAKRVGATRKAFELAGKQLEAEMKRYDNGQSTTYNVLEFQKQLTQAESNLQRAVVDHNIAKLKLLRSTGLIDKAKG